jgi:poly-gamma-glutamate synthesis protein (capsule biosynthesis protein)
VIARLSLLLACCGALRAAEPYPLLFDSPVLFRQAIEQAGKENQPLKARITGVTVPHHLLAADMIAATLHLASAGKYERIVLLAPDHFRRATRPAATTRRPFRTALGEVRVDDAAVSTLLADESVAESNLFSHEHGVHAILPFLAAWFPGVPVLPMAIDVRSRPADWERLADLLEPLVKPRTLVIQSTDFSHYLAQPVAARHDQETLRCLAAGDAAGIPALLQPQHLDSKAAQWIQMTLQQRLHGCGTPLVVDNRNAIRYGGRPDEPRTTSYITQLFSPDFIPASALPGEAWYFGGDTHFGRHVAQAFADPERADFIRREILRVTAGRPLIVNLEGVILEEKPSAYDHPMRIGMAAGLALTELKKLGVTAVSIANNHALDHGAAAREAMVARLRQEGIAVAMEGPPLDLGRFRLGAASDVANRPQPARHLLTRESFAAWKPAAPPLIAFLHAGTEYADAPSERERQLAAWAEDAGASLVLGCHPHRPSPGWERSGRALHFHSLGNLIFDQTDPANGGGLVELRFFEQDTWTARWIPLGNLFHRSLEAGKAKLPGGATADGE